VKGVGVSVGKNMAIFYYSNISNPSYKGFVVPAEWTRFSVTKTIPAGETIQSITHRVDFVNGGVDPVAGNDVVYLWGSQVEERPFATSYIPTTTTSVTRAADHLNIPISGNRNAATDDMSILLDMDHKDNSSGVSNDVLNFGVGESNLLIRSTGPSWNASFAQIYYGLSNFINLSPVPIDGVSRLGFSKLGTTLTPYINSEVWGLDLSTTVVIGTATTISVAGYCHIRNLRIYDRALTSSEMVLA